MVLNGAHDLKCHRVIGLLVMWVVLLTIFLRSDLSEG